MNRGSTWRRWDLHVHSPASYESDFDSAAKDATWNDYADALAKAAQDRDVRAISLQDYFTTKGYDELISRNLYDPKEKLLYGEGSPQPLLIIPGMEIRLDNFLQDDAALNVHLYFDPSLYNGSINVFLRELECFEIGGQTVTAEESDFVQYGHAQLQEESIDRSLQVDDLPRSEYYGALYQAASEATASLQELKGAITSYKRHHGTHRRPLLIGVSATGHGSVAELGWDGRSGQIRKEITRSADLVLSSNEKDRDFYLGAHPDCPPNRLRNEVGGLKPCVWGSDAHSLETLLHPSAGNTDRYLWIKGEPTFEGLRQLQYEPEGRVRVQEENPQTKAQYRTIKRFSLNSPDYANCEILFNRDLTVVIGGKSTGKSFLLYGLAATMDRDSAAERHTDTNTVKWYDSALEAAEAEITWDDGSSFSFREGEKSSRVVSYIPQGYINRLAERPDELNRFVLDVLTEKNEFRRQREDLKEKISKKKEVVSKKSEEILDILSEKDELLEERRRLGDREGIEKEIDRLEEELERLKERSNMSDEEREEYEELKEMQEDFSSSLENTERSLDELDKLQHEAENIKEEFSESIEEAKRYLDVLGEYFVPVGSTQNVKVEDALNSWLTDHREGAQNLIAAVDRAVESYKDRREEINDNIQEISENLEPYEKKLALREEVERVEKSLQREREKLSRLEEIDEQFDELDDRHDELNTAIAEAHAELFTARKHVAEDVQSFLHTEGQNSNGDDAELEVVVRPVTEGEDLARRLNNMLDGRRVKSNSLTPLTGTDEYYFEDKNTHVEVLEEVLSEITGTENMSDLGFKEEYEAKNILNALTEDWFSVQYSLRYEGETIISMSPGQRGMVLLQFLLERSEADYPILLDQPEDNLDNRTIYNHVVQALRDRKTKRQIVIVTHDPNLAVATDAEQLIVAEQTSEAEREDGMDRFLYAAGALESDGLSEELDPEIGTVRDWVCEILEGGADAFRHRHLRYNLPPLNR